MGTEILRPQDCLNQRLRFNPASFSNPNRSCRKQAFRSEHKRRSPPPFSSSPPKAEPSSVSKKPTTVADDRKLGKNLVLGQVKILKRGENIDPKNHKNQNLKKSFSADLADLKKKSESENLRKTSSGDLKSFSGRLGPNPEQVTARFADLKPLNGRSDVYAGSTFDMSPSPRALPLPKFSMRREAVSVSAFDDSATQDLRRLLRIG